MLIIQIMNYVSHNIRSMRTCITHSMNGLAGNKCTTEQTFRTLESVGLLNCIYQRGRVSRITDTELLLLIAHLILAPGSIPGVG